MDLSMYTIRRSMRLIRSANKVGNDITYIPRSKCEIRLDLSQGSPATCKLAVAPLARREYCDKYKGKVCSPECPVSINWNEYVRTQDQSDFAAPFSAD